MILYPAIDIQGGECVRLRRGDFTEATVFSTDPVAHARLWEKEGARALHVVDLDGAREGRLVNLALVEGIAEAVSIPVQYGGGIRTLDDLGMLAGGSISRFIIGTGAVHDESFLTGAVGLAGGRLIVSVDAERGMVVTHGWQEHSMVSAIRFATYLKEKGIEHIMYTDIERDGMMMGMNLEAVRELAQAVGIDIIASGGVSSLDDIRRIKELGLDSVSGVIVGRALYEGRFTIAEANAVLE